MRNQQVIQPAKEKREAGRNNRGPNGNKMKTRKKKETKQSQRNSIPEIRTIERKEEK